MSGAIVFEQFRYEGRMSCQVGFSGIYRGTYSTNWVA